MFKFLKNIFSKNKEEISKNDNTSKVVIADKGYKLSL